MGFKRLKPLLLVSETPLLEISGNVESCHSDLLAADSQDKALKALILANAAELVDTKSSDKPRQTCVLAITSESRAISLDQ